MRKFETQKEAENHYGHNWKFIQRHFKVTRCYTSQGFRGYFIEKP